MLKYEVILGRPCYSCSSQRRKALVLGIHSHLAMHIHSQSEIGH